MNKSKINIYLDYLGLDIIKEKPYHYSLNNILECVLKEVNIKISK